MGNFSSLWLVSPAASRSSPLSTDVLSGCQDIRTIALTSNSHRYDSQWDAFCIARPTRARARSLLTKGAIIPQVEPSSQFSDQTQCFLQ
jgi:hypothetical protein